MTVLQGAAPRDLAGLKPLLASATGPVHYISGGTDLLVAPRALPDRGLLVDISGIGGLSYVHHDGGWLRIGATTSLAALARNETVSKVLRSLARAAEQFGSAQIRNRATIGGNVANASPAGDLLPVLKCVNAFFTVLGIDSRERHLTFDELILGSGNTALTQGDLITEIAIPQSNILPLSGFVKLGRRADLTVSRLNLAMQAEYHDGLRKFGTVRLIAGAIGPVPMRLISVEDSLRGITLTTVNVRAFLESLVAAVDRAIPGRASQSYKRRAIMGLGLDLLEQVTGIAQTDKAFEDALR
jgi:carbon-monoxide dehydrogenase medium subunit